MNCLELITDIIKIEAYDFKEITLSVPFTHDMAIESSSVSFSGTPVVVSMKENSAEARTTLSTNDAGDLYENTLSWKTDDNLPETLRQVGSLSASRKHYLITTYDGTRKLVYNWIGIGRTKPDASISGSEETISMSFKVSGRIPILTFL